MSVAYRVIGFNGSHKIVYSILCIPQNDREMSVANRVIVFIRGQK